MAYEIENPIDYSATGDDIDAFAQKVKATQEQTFTILNLLNTNGAQAGTDVSDKEPYSWVIDTNTNTIGMVSADGEFIEFGSVEANLGLTPEIIGAVKNRSGFGAMMCGPEANLPTEDNETYDWYFAYDAKRIYVWTGSAWTVAFSLQFKDMLDYEAYCVSINQVGYSGADKILRLDAETGKGNIDITGSPERLCDIEIDVQNLRDNHVLTYNAKKNKFVNLPKDEVYSSEVAYGEADKILRVGADGNITVDTEGSAEKLNGVPANLEDKADRYVLTYDEESGYIIAAVNDAAQVDGVDVSTTGIEDGFVLAYDADAKKLSPVVVNAVQVGGIKVDTSDIADNYILIYNKASKKFKVEVNSAAQIDGIPVTTEDIADSQALVYDAESGYFVPTTVNAAMIAGISVDVDGIGDGKILAYNEADEKFEMVTNNAAEVGGIPVSTEGIKEGYTLAYDSASGTFKPVSMIQTVVVSGDSNIVASTTQPEDSAAIWIKITS